VNSSIQVLNRHVGLHSYVSAEIERYISNTTSYCCAALTGSMSAHTHSHGHDALQHQQHQQPAHQRNCCQEDEEDEELLEQQALGR
jgi:hypothetical protein